MKNLKILFVFLLLGGLIFQANNAQAQDASDKSYWIDQVKVDVTNAMDLYDFDGMFRWFMNPSGKYQIKIKGVANHIYPYELVINVNKNVGVANLEVYSPYSHTWYCGHTSADIPSNVYDWDWVEYHFKGWWNALIVEMELNECD